MYTQIHLDRSFLYYQTLSFPMVKLQGQLDIKVSLYHYVKIFRSHTSTQLKFTIKITWVLR